MSTDRRIKGRPLTDLLDTAAELERLEQRTQALRNSQGELLRSARLSAGLSLGDLASSYGSSPSYISQVENGVRPASSSTLFRIASSISTASNGTADLQMGEQYGFDVNPTQGIDEQGSTEEENDKEEVCGT